MVKRRSMDYFEFVDPDEIKRERRKAQELRQSSWWRQRLGEGKCYHCGAKFPKEQLTMDHVVPVARGGKSTKKNVVVSCKDCNSEKGHRMSVEMTLEKLAAERGAEAPNDQPENRTVDLVDVE